MDNRVWVKDAVMTIRLPEEVDHFVADRLREEAGEILVERNVREVVFDFRKTVFMDSSGIGGSDDSCGLCKRTRSAN